MSQALPLDDPAAVTVVPAASCAGELPLEPLIEPAIDPSVVPYAVPSDSLAQSVVALVALTAVQPVLAFVRGMVFCRWLEPAQLGEWDLVLGFVTLAAPVALLGVPGSFGRYVERYRMRGQLRTFLTSTSVVSFVLAVLAVGLLIGGGPWFSRLIFSTPDRLSTMALVAVCLAAVIAFGFANELLIALRRFRVASGLQLVRSVVFLLVGLALLELWQLTATSVIAAYSVACLLTALLASLWLATAWREVPPGRGQPLTQRELWPRLMPFALWIWAAAALANLFEVVDRYMIVHFSRLPTIEALTQVGHYHSSRVLPLLFVAFASTLAAMILPHLSRDWESGRREAVVARLNLFLKFFGFAFTLGGAVVLLAAPLLFGVALEGKYDGGLAVLPWTLTYCIWFALLFLVEDYLWCAEKARLGSLALLAGLLANVGLNLVLLPRLGLLGAVLATTASKLLALALVCLFSRRLGLRFERATLLACALPLCLIAGAGAALAMLAAVAVAAVATEWCLSHEQRRELLDIAVGFTSRLPGWRRQPS